MEVYKEDKRGLLQKVKDKAITVAKDEIEHQAATRRIYKETYRKAQRDIAVAKAKQKAAEKAGATVGRKGHYSFKTEPRKRLFAPDETALAERKKRLYGV